MKNEEEYIKHIKESWEFSRKITNETLNLEGHLGTDLILSIFKKCCNPYHCFLQNIKDAEKLKTKLSNKPTDSQVIFARKLKIRNPRSYIKKSLSKKIDETLEKREAE